MTTMDDNFGHKRDADVTVHRQPGTRVTGVKMSRKEAIGMEDLMRLWMRRVGITAGMNRVIFCQAWDRLSGAERYTISRTVRNGVMYCSLSSSIVRNQLYYRKESILSAINQEAKADPLFSPEDKFENCLKSIVLK